MTPMRQTCAESAVERLDVSVYRVPTDMPESDGTLTWDKTILVMVEATAGGTRGLGYTYADTATARVIRDLLAEVVQGRDAMAVPGIWTAMLRAVRNLGRVGVTAMAIAAVDGALWDLKARLLELPLGHAARGGARPRAGVWQQ
jgi:L-alanine-DL-glutamate epimerase-like enolase superfamily enzyme